MVHEAGRVALVTGAARGIGAATVARLVGAGVTVVAVDSCGSGEGLPAGVRYPLADSGDLEALVARHGESVLPVVADVRDLNALRAAADLALSMFGRLDVGVACAAVVVGGQPVWETPAEHFQTLLDVDVVGVWNTAVAVVPHMLAGPDPSGCRFVAVASAAAEHGLFRLAGYNTAKHAVVGIVRGLSADLVGTGVTAVAVSPGSTDTPMLSATADIYGVTIDELAQSQQLRRVLGPDEIAATIALCCSLDGASLNGSVVSATGGFTP